MYTTIILFYLSLVGMVLMIVLKKREVRSGNPTLFSKLGSGSDGFLRRSVARVRQAFGYFNRRTFAALVQLIAYHILLRVRRVYVELKHRALSNPHGKKLIDAVRGRAEVKYHGASFYLRRIGDK